MIFKKKFKNLDVINNFFSKLIFVYQENEHVLQKKKKKYVPQKKKKKKKKKEKLFLK